LTRPSGVSTISIFIVRLLQPVPGTGNVNRS
jgi:hypothetical protein